MDVESLREAARVIDEGGIVAYPTEACYGLGCDPRQHDAVRRLLHIKRRPRAMGLIIIGACVDQLAPYVDLSSPLVLARVTPSWPGPYTWLVPARTGVSCWVRGDHDMVAVRVTAHPGAVAMCRHSRRAIVSTSANRHHRRPALSSKGVQREFGNDVDYVLPGRLGGYPSTTEIRNAITNEVIRPA